MGIHQFLDRKKWLALLSMILLLLFLSSSFAPWSSQVTAISRIAYPFHLVELLWYQGSQGLSRLWHRYVDLTHVSQENQQLRQEIAELKSLLIEHRRLSDEVLRLQKILDFKVSRPQILHHALVISQGGVGYFEGLKINQGSAGNIAAGMAVISVKGLVGTVIRTSPYESFVQPLTSVSARTDILVARTRLRGVIQGIGGGKLLWQPGIREDLKIGDSLISSGIVGALPKGYPVARVSKITYGLDRAFQQVELQPEQELNKLEYVFVIANREVNTSHP
ncbi:MAG: rod shape-determining protein MreC [Proteobacteria bacterium]|nr:rod shape-determining protein MreC [Pseudomonadota bacterium]